MKKRTVSLTWLTALAGLLALSSCDSTTSSGMGTVRLHLVASGSPSFASAAEQADFGDITSATVTISHVELMPGHVTIDLGADEVTLNLLDMEGDVTRLLGSAPALGSYEQLRLIVSDVTVTLADGSELPARVPSGPQTGIKVDFAGPVTVGPGATVDLLVLFDVEKSFVFQGPPSAPRSVHFQPVVHATTMEAASIGGQVTVNRAGGPAATVAVTVTASVSGSVTATVTVDVALADAATTGTGNYLMRYLQPGLTYTMAASAAGYPTVSPPSGDAARDIAAVAGSNTGPNFTLAP